VSNQWRVRWSIAAVNDLDEIIEYIALRDSPGAAARMHSTIVQQVDTLSTNARRGCIMPELRDIGVREFRELIVSPCRICFSIAKREVVLYSLRVKTPPHPDPLPRWGEGRVRGKGGFSSVTSITGILDGRRDLEEILINRALGLCSHDPDLGGGSA